MTAADDPLGQHYSIAYDAAGGMAEYVYPGLASLHWEYNVSKHTLKAATDELPDWQPKRRCWPSWTEPWGRSPSPVCGGTARGWTTSCWPRKR